MPVIAAGRNSPTVPAYSAAVVSPLRSIPAGSAPTAPASAAYHLSKYSPVLLSNIGILGFWSSPPAKSISS